MQTIKELMLLRLKYKKYTMNIYESTSNAVISSHIPPGTASTPGTCNR